MLPSNNSIIHENNPNAISSNLSTDDYSLVNNYHENLFTTTSSSLSYFPTSPFNYYDSDYFFLEPYQNLPLEEATTTKTTDVNEMISKIDSSTTTNNEVIVDSKKKSITTPRNRTSKKDRHSKINTAKGPRDRRMRLSLEIAREFFGLQDMLGFDKASMTVEWLLTKAKHDIKKIFSTSIPSGRLIHTIDSSSVAFGEKSGSSTSECEVISGIIDHQDKPISKCGTTITKEKSKHKEVKKPVVRSIRTRDMREKAREKARERTKVKKFSETNVVLVEESNQVGSSWTPPLEVEKPARAQERGCAGAPINKIDTNADDSFVMMEKWSPDSIFIHLQGRTEEEHQFEDFQVYGIPWDSYNI